jgi:sigma-B regulation protein RsbU (phosphoserine phosphatase)
VKFVRRMNEQFADQAKLGSFATALVTTYFAPTSLLSLCNAGHPAPLVYRADERRWRFVEYTDAPEDKLADMPLGIVDLADYQQLDIELASRDMVLCYTDSLPEARLADGTFLGMDGLLEIAQTIDVSDPTTLIPRLVQAIESYCGATITGDDVTLLLFRPNVATAEPALRTRLLAPFRVTAGMLKTLLSGQWRVPMPDFRLANVLGAFFPGFNRLWRAGRHR